MSTTLDVQRSSSSRALAHRLPSIFAALYSCLALASHSSGLDTNEECLKAFRHSVVDAYNSLSSWDVSNFSGPPGFVCSWTGVTCWNGAENRIRQLNLPGAGLAGDFSPAGLSKCTSLEVLDLSNNSFSGPLPLDLCQQLPYLTTLDLSDNYFSGHIPVALQDCTYLETLKLQDNRLSGKIPRELATLPHLTVLNLSSNFLSGPIPNYPLVTNRSSLLQNPFDNSFAFLANPRLCGPPLSSRCNGPQLPVVVEIAISAVALLLLLILLFIAIAFSLRVQSRRQSLKSPSAPTSVEMFDSHLRLSWKSLEQATSSFSHGNILGVGGSSTVYKGKLLDGKMIAIKVMQTENPTELCTDHVQKQFFTELQVLGKLRHRNLVRISGYCYNMQDTMAIILDFMPMGSLDALLHNHTILPSTILGRNRVQQSNSEFQARFRILLGIAEGLAYLHHEYDGKRCVIHGDLKPGNVLLDEQMEAHIADFGLSRMVGATNTTSIATPSRHRVLPDTREMWWSFGYTAPGTCRKKTLNLSIKGHIVAVSCGFVEIARVINDVGADQACYTECAQQGVVSRKADVFSFGVITLEVMTGERPSSSKLDEGATLADWVGKALASDQEAVEGVVAAALKDEGSCCGRPVDADIVTMLKLGCRCTSYQPAARPDMQRILTFLHDLAEKQEAVNANVQMRHRHDDEDEVWMLSCMS